MYHLILLYSSIEAMSQMEALRATLSHCGGSVYTQPFVDGTCENELGAFAISLSLSHFLSLLLLVALSD